MKVSVIGAGSFGTAIAQITSTQVDEVCMFTKNVNVINSINSERINKEYFSSVKLNSNIKVFSFDNFNKISNSDLIIFALPSGATLEVLKLVKGYIKNIPVLSTAKGIEYPTLRTISQVISNELKNTSPVMSLSGPTFADELIRLDYSGITLGCNNKELKKLVRKIFPDNLIIDYSEDVKGVEYCGILKNVYAIALGIWDSVYSDNNGHFMFLNCCFKEMQEHITNLSDDKSLIFKFCGFGDFNLTANVDKSRNRTLGLMIGKKIIKIDKNLNNSIIFEGQKSAKAVYCLAQKEQINAPIANFVDACLNNQVNVTVEIFNLLKIIMR